MKRVFHLVFAIVVVTIIGGGGLLAFKQWQGRQSSNSAGDEKTSTPVVEGSIPARLTPQARQNLALATKPAQLTTYWRKLDLPGVITDRLGISDRGVVAPVSGIVTQIHAHPGDAVPIDSPLFSIRLVSESIQAAQLELFKATKEIEIAEKQKNRLSAAAKSGSIPESRIIEIDNQIERMNVTVVAYRQDLKTRGFPADRIDAAAQGEFLTEITIKAPGERPALAAEVAVTASESETPPPLPFHFEMQELKVQLGQQVDAGAVLCFLADHRSLMIEGRGFKEDMPLIQEAARQKLPIEVEFETPGAEWPPLPQEFFIHHVANTIDLQTRTFAFYLVLENQGRAYENNGVTRLLWRFRPGDRVRLRLAVEKFENVFAVPQAAIVREGPEAYVFRQNGDLFDRKPVHILFEDRTNVVIANDGSVRPGFAIAQNGAASINRVLKAQASSGMPAGLHVHADGTVHEAH
jgi:membrane fusion protein, heavy metal efflux system